MSNRFHNKFHRHNHHTNPTDRDNLYPDSAYDPIASPEAPFQGEFHVNGDMHGLSSLYVTNSAFADSVTARTIKSKEDVTAGILLQAPNVLATSGLTALNQALIDGELRVTEDVEFEQDQITGGDLAVRGNSIFYKTVRAMEVNKSSIAETPRVLVQDEITKNIVYNTPNKIIWNTEAEFLTADDMLPDQLAYYSGLNTLRSAPITVAGLNTTFLGDVFVTGDIYDMSGGTNSTEWAQTATIMREISTQWLSAIEDMSSLDQVIRAVTTDEGVTVTFKNALCSNTFTEADLAPGFYVKSADIPGKRNLRQSLLLYDNDVNIGVGTTNPVGKVHISTGDNINGDCNLVLESNTNQELTNPSYPGIILNSKGLSSAYVGVKEQNALQIKAGNQIEFYTGTSTNAPYTSAIQRLSITSQGQVKVGQYTENLTVAMLVSNGLSSDNIFSSSLSSNTANFNLIGANTINVSSISANEYLGFHPEQFSALSATFTSLSAGEYLGDIPIVIKEPLPSLSVDGSFIGNVATFQSISASQYLGIIDASNAITSLTGDISASGAGVVQATLKTINGVEGTWGGYQTGGSTGVMLVPRITLDDKGRVTQVTPIAFQSITKLQGDVETPAGATGTATATLKTLVPSPSGTYGAVTRGTVQIPKIVVDKAGRVIEASTTSVPFITSIEGDIIITERNDGNIKARLITPGSMASKSGPYGTSTKVPCLTVDPNGRITNIEEQTINFSASDATFNTIKANTIQAGQLTQSAVFYDSNRTGSNIPGVEVSSRTSNTNEQVIVLDLSKGNVFDITLTSKQIITDVFVINTPNLVTYNMILIIRHHPDASSRVTWPMTNFGTASKNAGVSPIRWPSGVVPNPTSGASKIDIFTFFTVNGVEWYGGIVGQGYSG